MLATSEKEVIKMADNIAEKMGSELRSISIAEFFEKNRHLLGYDNPSKALLTVVKEAIDNSMDACEEADILPDIDLKISNVNENRFKLSISDNGPGIVKKQIPQIFGKLLYGSKFHKLQQSRGQQGIGISSAVLYSQLTTGKSAIIKSKTSNEDNMRVYKLKIDIIKNEPEIVEERKETNKEFKSSGTKIEIEVEGKYIQKQHSVDEYLKQTAIINPYARITYVNPKGEEVKFERSINSFPRKPKEIRPHPHGVELGILSRMLATTKFKSITAFLQNEFSKVGNTSAEEICRLAKIPLRKKPKDLEHKEQERLIKAMQTVKLMRPSTDCLSPIGESKLKSGLEKETNPEYLISVSRRPVVYRGNPFQIEASIAYGGELMEDPDSSVKLMRFANKVPLLYKKSDCAITKAVSGIKWRRYGFDQPGGNGIPKGPGIILVHMASTWVPFTSESKEAIANYPQILKEIKLAVQDCARKVMLYKNKQLKAKKEGKRKSVFENYIPLIAEGAKELAGIKKDLDTTPIINKVINRELMKYGKKEDNQPTD